MKRFAICHLGKFYPPHRGGMETHIQDLVRRQSRSVTVRVIVASDSCRRELQHQDGATIIRVPNFGRIASMPMTPSLPLEFYNHRPRFVHVHTPNPAAAFTLAVTGYRGPLVVTHHSDTVGRAVIRKVSDPFVRTMMGRADRIIVTSRNYLESSQELSPYRSKCTVIPLGIDLKKWEDGNSDGKQCDCETQGKDMVLAVGRLVPYKGLPVLIAAMRSVDAKLVIIGTGPMESVLIQIVQDMGLSDKVKFLGHVEDVAPYYRAASVLVLPSITRAEAFGIVQMEAMACGLPVINTSLDSGVPEVSLDGFTGITVPPGDSEALARALQQLLGRQELRKSMGQAARNRVRTEFSADLMAQRTLELYGEVLRERGLKFGLGQLRMTREPQNLGRVSAME